MNLRWMLVVVGLAAIGQSAVAQIPTEIPVEQVESTVTTSMAPDPRLSFRIDYLLGWIEGTNPGPLVTTSAAGTPRLSAGVLGSPTTGVLFDDDILDGVRSGFRADGRFTFDEYNTMAIEAGFWLLGHETDSFLASSGSNPILARPFFNAATGAAESVLVAFPGQSNGVVHIQAESNTLFGGHVALSEKLFDIDWMQCDCLIGYRFYRYDDSFRMQQSILPTAANFVPGTRITSTDDFGAQNEFHGVDWGLRAEIEAGRLTFGMLAKLAVGRVRREVTIAGGQTITVPGQTPLTQAGGVLALNSNIGTFSDGDWSVLPEFGVTLRYQVTDFMEVMCGYSLLLLDDVARASEHIDQTLDPNLFPPAGAAQTSPARPASLLTTSDVVVQFFNIGVGIRY